MTLALQEALAVLRERVECSPALGGCRVRAADGRARQRRMQVCLQAAWPTHEALWRSL